MTREEEKQQLREQARIPQFEARFEAFMQGRAAQDQSQVIGRDYDHHFERGGDLDRQRNEQIERVDREFDTDSTGLERQNKDERVGFESWMKEQRETMRAEDAAERPEKAAPRLVPSLDYGPAGSQSAPQREPVKDFAQKESLRNDAGEEIRQRFDEYQTQQHADRLETLSERRDTNIDELDAAHGQEVERQRADFEKPLPWESQAEASAGADKAMEHAQQHPSRSNGKEWDFEE